MRNDSPGTKSVIIRAMRLSIPGNRALSLAIFAFTMATMGIVLYMQYAMFLPPCGLCISQRVFIILCGVTCLACAVHNPGPKGQRAYAGVAGAMTIFGGYFAGRQIWLQHLPEDQIPACGPGLNYLLANFPLVDALNFLLRGDGNCAEVQFRFLGLLSIPEMAMIAFAALFAACMFMLFRDQWEAAPAQS